MNGVKRSDGERVSNREVGYTMANRRTRPLGTIRDLAKHGTCGLRLVTTRDGHNFVCVPDGVGYSVCPRRWHGIDGVDVEASGDGNGV